MGTSTKPVFLIFPTSENILVPLLPSVPICENQSAPFLMICGTLAQVSTLFILVGLPQSPLRTGKGGRCLGIPLFPSIEAISAVSSPHTKAPEPLAIFISKLNPEPNIFSPRIPISFACFKAIPIFSTARGYSFLTYIQPSFVPMAKAPISIPSMTAWGFPSRRLLSI